MFMAPIVFKASPRRRLVVQVDFQTRRRCRRILLAYGVASWSKSSPHGRSRRLVVLLVEADAADGAGKERRRALERVGKERRDALAWEKQQRRAYTSRQRLPIPIASKRVREEREKKDRRRQEERRGRRRTSNPAAAAAQATALHEAARLRDSAPLLRPPVPAVQVRPS